MAQLSNDFYELIQRLKAEKFKVNAKTHNNRIEIYVEDIDRIGFPFESRKPHDEAFLDFVRQLKEVFDWSDGDTKFAMFMAEFNRRADAQEKKRADDPMWNPATLTRAEQAADKIIQNTKQRSEIIKLDRERAVEILWQHAQALDRRGIDRDDDLESLINGDELFFAQRKFSDRHGANLIAAMERGEWKLTHQGLAIADDGFCLDGQHRSMAVAICGIPVPMMITYNVDDSVFPVIDTGKSRTASDILSMLNIKNPTAVATVIRLMYFYDNFTNPKKWYAEPLSNEQIRQQLIENYLNIGDAYNHARSLTTSKRHRIELSTTAMAAAHYIITRAWPAAPIEEFWTNVQGGNIHPYYHGKYEIKDYDNNPGHALHRFAAREAEKAELHGSRRKKGQQKSSRDLIMILRAWNDINKLKVTHRYQWLDLEEAPKPYVGTA